LPLVTFGLGYLRKIGSKNLYMRPKCGIAKMSRDIFSKVFDHIFVFWLAFSKEKG